MLKLENGREVLFSGRVDNADVPWITDSIKSVIEVSHTQLSPCSDVQVDISLLLLRASSEHIENPIELGCTGQKPGGND